MPIVILDIETRPDKNLEELFMGNIKASGRLKDPEKIAADIAKKKEQAVKDMSVDHDFSSVFCVGIKPLGEPAMTLTFDEFVAWVNEEVEGEGADAVPTHRTTAPRWKYTKFVTFNGKWFDWPVIIKNGIKSGSQLPYGHFVDFCDKYDRSGAHIDMQEKLELVYTPLDRKKSLDKYLQIYLGIQKKEIDFATCSDQELIDHCLEDLDNTEKMFHFWNKYFSFV